MSVSAKLSAEEVAGVCVRIGLVRDVALESPKISLANLTSIQIYLIVVTIIMAI